MSIHVQKAINLPKHGIPDRAGRYRGTAAATA